MRVEVASRKDVLNSFLKAGKKKKKRLPLPLISPDSAASTLLHCSFRETAQRVKHTGARGKRLPIIFPPCSVMRSAGRRSSTERGEKSRGKKGRMRPGEGKVILWDWLRSSSRRRPGQQLSPVARAAEEPGEDACGCRIRWNFSGGGSI